LPAGNKRLELIGFPLLNWGFQLLKHRDYACRLGQITLDKKGCALDQSADSQSRWPELSWLSVASSMTSCRRVQFESLRFFLATSPRSYNASSTRKAHLPAKLISPPVQGTQSNSHSHSRPSRPHGTNRSPHRELSAASQLLRSHKISTMRWCICEMPTWRRDSGLTRCASIRADNDEKSKQAPLVKYIYQHAAQVLIWLGLADQSTGRVLDLIRLAADCLPLIRLLTATNGFRATNPRNRIFALLGLVGEEMEFPIDYNMLLGELYTKISRYFFYYRCLSCLKHNLCKSCPL
jgi:hypothetical protein